MDPDPRAGAAVGAAEVGVGAKPAAGQVDGGEQALGLGAGGRQVPGPGDHELHVGAERRPLGGCVRLDPCGRGGGGGRHEPVEDTGGGGGAALVVAGAGEVGAVVGRVVGAGAGAVVRGGRGLGG